MDDVLSREAHADADGYCIRYLEAGSGAPVLRIHGATGPQLTRTDTLLAKNYRIIAVELPGFGASTNERSKSARDLAHTMTSFVAALDLRRCNVIGSSLGAKIALWRAPEDGENIEALVLIAPGAVAPDGWRPPVGPDRECLYHPERQSEAPDGDSAIRDKERAFIQRALRLERDEELEKRLAGITAATLVVFGTEDAFVQSETGRIYKTRIPNCSFALVYDAGHMIESERPEAAAELLDDFLERHEVFVVAPDSTVIKSLTP